MGQATVNILRQCAPIFAILQDESRQEILLHLFDFRELTVNGIASRMSISRSAVSHHLKQLLLTGVVVFRKEGKERYYRLSLDHSLALLRELLTCLEQDQKELQG